MCYSSGLLSQNYVFLKIYFIYCYGNHFVVIKWKSFISYWKRLEKSSKTGFTGPETGLTFILNTTTSDYYFSTGDFVGFKVQICSPTEFPDVQNGGLTQLFVDTNTKSYFKLIPTTIDSKRAIEQYSPIQRGCLFEHELFEQYAGHYSFVDCLLKCKLRNIITLCGCMPFFLPVCIIETLLKQNKIYFTKNA